MTVPGRQSSHHRAWSVMLPEVVGRVCVCVCMYLHQAQTPQKKTIKERYSMHGD